MRNGTHGSAAGLSSTTALEFEPSRTETDVK